MTTATINRLITLFDDAFRGLSTQASMEDAERLAVLIHHSMNSKNRSYHTPEHIFGMCEGMKPLQVLAALFHDVVYYQLDGGFPPPAAPWLQDVVTCDEDAALVLQEFGTNDPALVLCAAIFQFTPGQALPLYGGMNEFLSAVLATRLLRNHLGLQDLLVIAACIEATIPFRAPNVHGQTAADVLAQRVAHYYQSMFPDCTPEEVEIFVTQAVSDAVALGNRDVSSFSCPDPSLFLSSTWQLIDESNAPLANPGVYSLREYRTALMRMHAFLFALDPTHVFQSYDARPDAEELDRLRASAQRNIGFACDFLAVKITAIAIVEALAVGTGNDCPVSMFLGDIRNPHGKPDRVEDFLPPAPVGQILNQELLNVFETGRALVSSYDLNASPLTAYVYLSMGHEGARVGFHLAREMFDGTLSPVEFLRSLDRALVLDISSACAHIAISRRDKLRALELAL